jgi:rod shape-determining protein MreB
VAIIANGEIVHARAERIGSEDINAAIVDHVRRHRGLIIGPQSAERLKLELASATLPADLAEEMSIKGLDVLTRSPGAIDITAGELYPVVLEVVRKIVEGLKTTLTELPPEVGGDIYERGIILTGGGAQFAGLEDFFREQTKLPVRIADQPKNATMRGLEQMFEEPLRLRRVIRRERYPVLDLEG